MNHEGAKDTKEEGRRKKEEEKGSSMIPQIYPVILRENDIFNN
jgi:hypothetical protein